MAGMTIYEAILSGHPANEGQARLRDAVLEATPVLIDNVAHYLFTESPQEEWDLRADFPNVAPPWPLAFYEYAVPLLTNTNGHVRPLGMPGFRMGLLMEAHRLDDVSLTGAAREVAAQRFLREWTMLRATREGQRDLLAAIRSASDEELWNAAGAEGRARVLRSMDEMPELLAQEGIRWSVTAWTFVMSPGGKLVQAKRLSYAVGEDGQMCPDGQGNAQVLVGVTDPNLAAMPQEDQMNTTDLQVPLLAISFSHCRNVVVVDAPSPTPRQQRRHAKLPKVTFKVLDILPVKQVLRDEGGLKEGGSLQRALHIARGHFKDYRERGLFGKIRGVFWWDQTVRGAQSAGIVAKEYRVRA